MCHHRMRHHRCLIQFYYGNFITCLLKLQKRAARLILEQPIEVPSIVLFRKLDWIPIFNLIKMRKILMVFNTLKTSWRPDLRKLFVFDSLYATLIQFQQDPVISDLKVRLVRTEPTEQTKSKISYSQCEFIQFFTF